ILVPQARSPLRRLLTINYLPYGSITDLLKALDTLGEHEQAARFAEEHERDRITPHTMRPIVERPLHPSEIPVREIKVRSRWWS
ncbi:hypothetical protein ACLQ24_29720, partial [Micromonospora sp. DT4]|uniref:hypothetical protein n=1 Tax=Micromonospora sp. DT4 TaxID=3393438 RepID=UPI003CF03385